jgi:restriction system protein
VAVPDFQTLMRPMLVLFADGAEQPVAAVRGALAEQFGLTPDDLAEELPSGRAKTFVNRVGWATTYLYRCGLLDRPSRSVYRITDRGRSVLESHPDRVDLSVLRQFKEFHEFVRPRHDQPVAPLADGVSAVAIVEDATPEERVGNAYRELRSALAAELLDRVLDQSPEFFEQLVLDVLYAMGYGGRRHDAVQRLGKSGDEGVDGVIREDTLGLDLIYVQAKRWRNPVSRPEIQKFVGALHGQRASKGVFITTSTFSADAASYADSITPRVILIDGKELAQLMIDHDVGVSVPRTRFRPDTRLDPGGQHVERHGGRYGWSVRRGPAHGAASRRRARSALERAAQGGGRDAVVAWRVAGPVGPGDGSACGADRLLA